MEELQEVTTKYQETQRVMVGHNEMTREREERIDTLNKKYQDICEKYEQVNIEYGILKIEHAKNMEMLRVSSADLQDTTEKLHLTNKVRHETEIKLGEAIEKTKGLQSLVELKETTLIKKA